MGLRKFNSNCFDEYKGYDRYGFKEFNFLLMLNEIYSGYVQENVVRMNKKVYQKDSL